MILRFQNIQNLSTKMFVVINCLECRLTKSLCACDLDNSKLITFLLHNLESWISIQESQIQKKFKRRVLAAPQKGTPKGIVEMDLIILKKLILVIQILALDNPLTNCKRALLNGKLRCKGGNLLTECQNWCKDIDLPDVTRIKKIIKHAVGD